MCEYGGVAMETTTIPEGFIVSADYIWDDASYSEVPGAALYLLTTDHPAAPDAKQWFDAYGRPVATATQDFKYGANQYFETFVTTSYDARGRAVASTLPFSHKVIEDLCAEIAKGRDFWCK